MAPKPLPKPRFQSYFPALLAIGVFAAAAALIGFDREPTSAFHDYMRPYDFWLQLVTYLGDGRVLLPACAALTLVLAALRRPSRWAPLGAAACVVGSGLVTNTLKMIIGRPRPYTDTDARYIHMPLDAMHWFTTNHDFESFPSGHSTAVFSVAWFAAMQFKKPAARAAALGLAVLVALSRVALYKHYFADTLAGAAVGIGMTELIASLFGLAGRPPLIRLRKPFMKTSTHLSLFALVLTVGTALASSACSTVHSRIHDNEGEFAGYTPEVQAQIQNGRIDRGFTEEMVYMALGAPSDKSSAMKGGKTVVTWRYAKPPSLTNGAATPSSLSAPYGYPGPVTGPTQTAPMFYEKAYFKVHFEGGKVTDWDDDLQDRTPPLGNGLDVK